MQHERSLPVFHCQFEKEMTGVSSPATLGEQLIIRPALQRNDQRANSIDAYALLLCI